MAVVTSLGNFLCGKFELLLSLVAGSATMAASSRAKRAQRGAPSWPLPEGCSAVGLSLDMEPTHLRSEGCCLRAQPPIPLIYLYIYYELPQCGDGLYPGL